MPVVLLERVPLPSLRSYTSISVLLLACSVYYSHQVLTGGIDLEETNHTDPSTNGTNFTRNITEEWLEEGYVKGTAAVMLSTTWCVWTLVNMAYCILILFGKLIQHFAFGDLRVSEQQNMKDKFWNFVFYKFIFIFGVMNVQDMGEVVLWCAWFSVLGFLHLLAQLCKDRFEYLSFSPTTPSWTHAKVVSLLVIIFGVSSFLFAVCIVVCYFFASLNTFAFMAAECILLMNKTLYVLTRYGIHLWELNHDEGMWENRAIYVYYSELIFELAGLSVDFVHHLHMLVWGNIFLSMASLVICMQLRYLFHEFQRRIKRHKNYLRVVNSMESKFPVATKEELENYNDDCAICWERMENGRKLPCGHFYHNACLRSWLEQDTSCPTCRTSLGESSSGEETPQEPVVPGIPIDTPPAGPGATPRRGNHTFNHFFHFDGSRYVSWLPSFSVEVTHTQILGAQRVRQEVQTSQLDNMARQVQEVFPSMPTAVILEDLRVTHSVEVTIENIIEGNVVAPPSSQLRNGTPSLSNSDSSESSHSSSSSLDSQDTAAPPSLPQVGSSSHQGQGDGFHGEFQLEEGAVGSNAINFTVDGDESEIPDEEPLSEPRDDIPTNSGFRFSKSSDERQQMLSKRKESLLENARRRYLEENPSSAGHGDSSASEDDSQSTQAVSTNDSLLRRRELAFLAAQRRLNSTN